MKKKGNARGFWIIIALAAVIGFIPGCDSPTGPGNGFVVVSSITGIPSSGTVGNLTLTGVVNPSDATNQTIAWSVVSAGGTGASISGNTLTTTAAGTVTVRATIADGAAQGTNYTQNFTITITGGINSTAITYTVTQIGGTNDQTDSTGITFTFSTSVDSLYLTAADIKVNGAVAKDSAATLTGSGTIRTLAPIIVNEAGLAYVSINKTGIQTTTKSVIVYKAGEMTPTLTGITAAYTGTAAIYPTTPLNDLKASLTVTATYSNSTTQTVTDYALSGTLTVGISTVTVTYEGETATFTVTVTTGTPSKTLTSITLNHASVKKDYTQNETLDLTGLIVTAAYSDNSNAVVTNYTSDPANGAALSQTGTITVTISYIEEAITKNNTFTVTVSALSDGTIIVTNTSEWNAALNRIRIGGDNKDYFINVSENIMVAGSINNTNTFGSVSGLSVTLMGSGLLSMSGSLGNMICLGENQTMIIDGVTLEGSNNRTSIVYVNAATARFELRNGTIRGNANPNPVIFNDGGGVHVTNGGTFIMSGGSISNNHAANCGGGVYVNNGTFTMSGGTISGNSAFGSSTIPYAHGGGVYVHRGTFTMTGGTIRRNSATTSYAYGGGVHINSGDATFRIVTGTVYGSNASTNLQNIASTSGAALNGSAQYGTFSGTTWNSNGSLSNTNNTIIVVDGELGGVGSITAPTWREDNAISLTAPQVVLPTVITQGWQISDNDNDGWSNFTPPAIADMSLNGKYLRYYATISDDETYYSNTVTIRVLALDQYEITIEMWDSSGNDWGGSGALKIKVNGTDLSTRAKKTNYGNGPVYYTFVVYPGDAVIFYWVAGTYQNENAFAVYYSDDPPNPAFSPTSGVTVDAGRLLLYQQYDSMGSVANNTNLGQFAIGNWEDLTLGRVTTTAEWTRALNYIRASGNNKDYTIEVIGDVEVSGNDSSLGTVTNITVTLTGNGKLYLTSNGSILNVGANQTLIIDSEDLILEGLRSGQNGATQDNSYSTITVSGTNAQLELKNGTISGNANYYGSSYDGGGVFIYGGSFTMTGGTISGNTASGYYRGGGGVYVFSATFTMTGGTISGNTASGYGARGGGVYITVNSSFTMTGGTISGNTASGYGGGVYVWEYGSFSKSSGTIYGYSASDTINSNIVKDYSEEVVSDQGHAVYVYVDSSTYERRETTAGPEVNLDSTKSGAEGGWEN
jgi:hypothetical protein